MACTAASLMTTVTAELGPSNIIAWRQMSVLQPLPALYKDIPDAASHGDKSPFHKPKYERSRQMLVSSWTGVWLLVIPCPLFRHTR